MNRVERSVKRCLVLLRRGRLACSDCSDTLAAAILKRAAMAPARSLAACFPAIDGTWRTAAAGRTSSDEPNQPRNGTERETARTTQRGFFRPMQRAESMQCDPRHLHRCNAHSNGRKISASHQGTQLGLLCLTTSTPPTSTPPPPTRASAYQSGARILRPPES